MHSSRIRTVRSSSRLLGREGLPQWMLGLPLPPGVGLATPWEFVWRPPSRPDPSISPPAPWVWAWRPPGVGLETPLQDRTLNFPPWVWAWRPPPKPDPSTSPLVVGLETPSPGQTPQFPPAPTSQTIRLPPWVWAWRPARHAGIPLSFKSKSGSVDLRTEK